MAEESESFKLWRQGLDDWREERLTEASIAFREAIAKAASDDIALIEYHQSLGQLLDEAGATAEARAALEKALELSLQRYKDESSAHVAIARCFLAEHFVRVLRFREATEVTEPSVGAGASVEGLVLCVRARAFHGMGQLDRARDEAQRALQLASSQEQRDKIARELGTALVGSSV